MNRIDRLIGIILLLQSHRIIRARDIAEHFDISTRTVYRDLRALDEAGVPIAAEAGEGYSLVEGYHLPPVMFTPEEASALFIGGKFAEQLTDESIKKNVQSALLKIRSVLPSDTQIYLERLQESTEIFTRPSSVQNGFRDDVLTTIQDSIVHRYILSMEYYTNYRDSFTKRDIEPLGLLYYGDRWHLIAYCRLRKDFRDFRTDRIKSIQLKDSIFSERKDFSLKNYLQQINRLENPQEVQVKFKKSVAKYVRDKYYHGLVEEKVEDSNVLMTFLVPSLRWIASWILSYGTSVEIISPEQLRQILLEEAEKLSVHYKKR
jgi:predicted DNA-binding transcriptional regulator YafY